jgi:RNA:NAD 2'-phosphotransferase (TPT1/KptA family)
LRHHLDELNHDESGYVKTSDLIICFNDKKVNVKRYKKLSLLNETILKDICEYDLAFDKHRLDLKNDTIRANQGHSSGSSIQQDKIFVEILEPLPYCVHGTEEKFIDSILTNGLMKMGRTHIHCISKNPTQEKVVSGFKKTSNAIIEIDMEATMDNGLKWFKSLNDVILTEGPIDPKFIKKVTIFF